MGGGDMPLVDQFNNLEDMEKDTSYYPYAALSCTVWLVSYKYVSPVISERYFPGYKALPRGKQLEWHTRVNSTIHAVISSMMCLYCMVYDEEISKDPVWADSKNVKYTCSVVVGYMASDSIIMVMHYNSLGELFYIFHHGASIYAYYYVMTYSSLCWFANFRLVAEFSTPFVNQRWFLDVLGYPKSSFTFIVNGLAMAMMFMMARILVIPAYWFRVYSIYGTDSAARLGGIWFVLVSSSGVLDTLNVYWFYKIYNGARKIINHSMGDSQKNFFKTHFKLR